MIIGEILEISMNNTEGKIMHYSDEISVNSWRTFEKSFRRTKNECTPALTPECILFLLFTSGYARKLQPSS